MAKNGNAASGSMQPNGNPTKRLPQKPQRPSVGAAAPRTITVRVPLTFGQRGGRKLVLTPNSTPQPSPQHQRFDNTLVKALARAHRWKQMLEGGNYASVTELAAAEKINDSYLCRLLRLTLLAPDIVEAILEGQGHGPGLNEVMKPFAVEWRAQHLAFRRATERV